MLTTNKNVVEEIPKAVVKSEKTDKEYIDACKKSRKCTLLLEAGYYEARGESDKGIAAVMYTVINRTKHPTKWPNTISGVLSQKYQFSYRFDGSMKKGFAEKEQRDRIAVIAMKVVEGKIPSPVGKAVFYHSDAVSPYWSKNVKFVKKVGRHLFYQ